MAGGDEDISARSGKRPLPLPTGRASAFDDLASGLGRAAAPSAFGWDGTDHAGAEHSLPGLHADERLPWLYSAEDDLDRAGVDPARVWAFVLTGSALLALMVGGVWWTTHRRDAGTQLADGSLITAPPGPIKEAPQDPGGKTFDGTGDSSFAVSQGHVPGATLAAGGAAAAGDATAGDGGAAVAPTLPASSPGGIGVQVGAYATAAAAEAAWAHLAQAYDALSGSTHRVVAGKADIGTVYGLQAVAGSGAAATALCDRLKAAGLNCQVKD